MRKSLAAFTIFNVLGASITFASASFAADTHVITTTSSVAWTYNGQSSKTNGTPVIVDDLKIGDIIEIKVPDDATHGLITIKRLANVRPPSDNETKDPVLACGESDKSSAMLREIDCGAASQFGQGFTGSMKLEVLANFTGEINFWCVFHHFGMTGTLKLRP